MAFTEDLSIFFDTNDFGEAATFTHVGGSPASINVIFDASYSDPLGIEGNHPRAIAMASDCPSIAHGDTLVVRSVTYKVVGIGEDGTGLLALKLQEQ